jgi:hypothetical protein
MPSQTTTGEQDAAIRRYVQAIPLEDLKRLATGAPDAMAVAIDRIYPPPILKGLRGGPLL